MKPTGIVALILSGCSGVVWALTASASQNCSLTMQLSGSTCYPFLVTIHSVAGGLTLVLVLLGIGLFIAGAAQRPKMPDCVRCGQPERFHQAGRCPPSSPSNAS